ncbi:MAG: hypothetical protein IKC51_09785, partial [Myxococcaceae bacterium]|nr:hypothetical protein [Myxococcaceae bacterium]
GAGKEKGEREREKTWVFHSRIDFELKAVVRGTSAADTPMSIRDDAVSLSIQVFDVSISIQVFDVSISIQDNALPMSIRDDEKRFGYKN